MRKVKDEISFSDASFKSLELTESDDLVIILESWDEKTIKIEFSNTIQFCYKLGDCIAALYEIPEGGAILNEALKKHYSTIPNDHPYKTYALLDISDFPFIEVVSDGVRVTKE